MASTFSWSGLSKRLKAYEFPVIGARSSNVSIAILPPLLQSLTEY